MANYNTVHHKMGYFSTASCVKLFVCLSLGSVLLVCAVLTVFLDPIVIISKYMTRLDDGTAMAEALMKETDGIHLQVYLFNITNAERFASGEDEKLNVQEVGPFTYQENRTNEDLEFDHEKGVLRYTPRLKVTFLPEESIGDPKKMVLTLPNIAMLAMASKVSTYGYLAKVGFNMLVRRLESTATVTLNVHDYLWGYDEPLIRLGNQYLPGWITFDKLGLFDRLYDEKQTMRYEVSTRNKDRFMIKTANGVGGLLPWGYERPETRSRCNSFTDTYEGLCYPPELTPERPIRLYRSILCRVLDFDYQGPIMTDIGVEAMLYKLSNRTYRKISENECLCAEGICYDGISDLSPCLYDLPLVMSNTHFMDTNPNLYSKIEGLAPDEKQHGSELIIEPTIGMVITTRFSVQVNVWVRDVGFNSKISKFSDMAVPVGYFKVIQPKIIDETVAALRLIHIYAPYIVLTVQILLTIAGFSLLFFSFRILYWGWIYPRKKALVVDFHNREMVEAGNKLLKE